MITCSPAYFPMPFLDKCEKRFSTWIILPFTIPVPSSMRSKPTISPTAKREVSSCNAYTVPAGKHSITSSSDCTYQVLPPTAITRPKCKSISLGASPNFIMVRVSSFFDCTFPVEERTSNSSSQVSSCEYDFLCLIFAFFPVSTRFFFM